MVEPFVLSHQRAPSSVGIPLLTQRQHTPTGSSLTEVRNVFSVVPFIALHQAYNYGDSPDREVKETHHHRYRQRLCRFRIPLLPRPRPRPRVRLVLLRRMLQIF